jgi:hypothetical protein
MSGVSNNPQGIVVPASALQQGNIAMTTVNSQVVSGWCTVLGIVGRILGEEGILLGNSGMSECPLIREGLPG